MATHSSIVAWRIPGVGAWWAAIYRVAQSRTRLTWLSSSKEEPRFCPKTALLFLDCSTLVSVSPPFPDQQLFSVQSVQSLRLFVTPWTAACQASLFITNSQTHAHWVDDAIQPSHPLLSPSPAFNLFQHQGLFKWVSSLHQVAKVLEFQHQSFKRIFRTDFL